MAEARTYDFIESLQEYLQNNVDNPNPNITGDERWVYDTEPSFDLPSYPRVHISTVNANPQFFEIASTRRNENDRVQAVVLHHVGDSYKMDVDGDDEEERPANVLDYISTEVADAVHENQSRWKNLGDNSLNAKVLNQQEVPTSKDSVIAEVVEIRFKNIR